MRIGHGPGKPNRYHWKGTDQIAELFKMLAARYGSDVAYDVLPQMPHAEMLSAQQKYHIWVDQICPAHEVIAYPPYRGGLDKVGLEAMAAGCAVVTSGGPLRIGDSVEEPPAVLTNPATALVQLSQLIEDGDKRNTLADAGRQWVRKVCNPEAVATAVVGGMT